MNSKKIANSGQRTVEDPILQGADSRKKLNTIRYTLYAKPWACGSAMLLVLFAVIILSVMGAGLLSLGLHGRMLSIQNASEISARSAADAGLAKAVFAMNEKLQDIPWDDNDLPQTTDETLANCDATFRYTVTGDSNGLYTVVSIGNSGHAQRQVSSTLRPKGLFEYGLLTRETITLEMNTRLYGYDSDIGSTDAELTIGTISTAPDSIVLGGGTSIIDGDVFVGFEGDTETIIQNGGTVINGRTYALTEELPFPVIIPPSLPDVGTMDIVAGTTVIGPADSGKYTNITLQDSGIVQIDGGDVVLHVTGNVVMNSDSQIQVEAGSSLTLYVDGSMVGDSLNNVEINNYTGIPVGLKLCLMGESEQTIEFKNNSDIFVAIYAPNTNVIFKNNTNFRGSIVARSVFMQNNSIFYYDVALQGEGIGNNDAGGVRFAIDRWQE